MRVLRIVRQSKNHARRVSASGTDPGERGAVCPLIRAGRICARKQTEPPFMAAPLLQQTLPSDNATGVSVTSNIGLGFNEAVRAGSG